MARPLDYKLNRTISNGSFSLSSIFKDNTLVFAVLALVIFGLFMLYSASGMSYSMVFRQAVYALLGFIGMLLVARVKGVS